MIGLIMAGGKGTRMDIPDEKLLLQYKKPIILHVVSALENSKCFTKILAATSKNSPKTRTLLEDNNISTIPTSGDGYVKDLGSILEKLDEPVLVTSGDLPLLDAQIIKMIISRCDVQNIWTSVLLSSDYIKSLNLSTSFTVTFNDIKCYYTGISIINAAKISTLDSIDESFCIINDKRIALNLNTKQDYELLSSILP